MNSRWSKCRRYKREIKRDAVIKLECATVRLRSRTLSGIAREIFDSYFTFITLMSLPPGFPMHFSAHQPQQQLAIAKPLNLRCDHENHSQRGSCAKRSRQIAVFRVGLPCLASVSWGLGEVRCIHSNFPRGSLKLRSAMKEIQFSQFDPTRLFTYVLSRLVESHAAEASR